MIRGYANIFNSITAPDENGVRLMTRSGAFDLSGSISFCFGHNPDCVFASTSDGSLRLWQDSIGLAVEVKNLPPLRASMSLVNGIARGQFCGLSPLFLANRVSHIETIKDVEIEIVERTTIGEISLVPDALCPGAWCWLAGTDANEVAQALGGRIREWIIGRGLQLRAAESTQRGVN